MGQKLLALCTVQNRTLNHILAGLQHPALFCTMEQQSDRLVTCWCFWLEVWPCEPMGISLGLAMLQWFVRISGRAGEACTSLPLLWDLAFPGNYCRLDAEQQDEFAWTAGGCRFGDAVIRRFRNYIKIFFPFFFFPFYFSSPQNLSSLAKTLWPCYQRNRLRAECFFFSPVKANVVTVCLGTKSRVRKIFWFQMPPDFFKYLHL